MKGEPNTQALNYDHLGLLGNIADHQHGDQIEG